MNSTEKPILFTTVMVKAILTGRKTETRRLTNLGLINQKPDEWSFKGITIFEKDFSLLFSGIGTNIYIPLPYGYAGSLIWVRESFKYIDDAKTKVDYKAQYTYPEYHKWKPSIHMPKAAARIWLLNTGVTCQRLRDISEQSAIAEGIELFDGSEKLYKCYGQENYYTNKAEDSFFTLISSIHGPEILELNPWVLVQKFKVLSTYGKPSQRVIDENLQALKLEQYKKLIQLSNKAEIDSIKQ
jgi:hypothetical protein